jgi:hypothetical protein
MGGVRCVTPQDDDGDGMAYAAELLKMTAVDGMALVAREEGS